MSEAERLQAKVARQDAEMQYLLASLEALAQRLREVLEPEMALEPNERMD